MSLYCRKDGKQYWNDETIYDDGSFFFVTKGRFDVDWCRCDSCNAPIKKNQEAYLVEHMTDPETTQYSQASNYFNLTTAEFRIRGLAPNDNDELYDEAPGSDASGPEIVFRNPRRKSRWNIKDLHQSMEAEELGLEYFEMAKAIMLDPDQNFIGDKELNGINFGIAVLEAADLALLQAQSQEVRESIFDALATYLEEYPEEFAHHLQMTSCVFGYTSLYGVEVTDVREFWSDLPAILEGGTVYQPPGLTAKFDKDSRYNQKTRWLKYAAELLLSGKKPIMIPDACCAGPVYDLKTNEILTKSLQAKVANAKMLINCPVTDHSFVSFYTTMIRAQKGF